MEQLLSGQELIRWCREKYGRIGLLAKKAGIKTSIFRSYFLDEKSPAVLCEKDSINFLQWMKEIEESHGGSQLEQWERRQKLNKWFDDGNGRAAEFLRLNDYVGRNAKVHCSPSKTYKCDIPNDLWKQITLVMKRIERKERYILKNSMKLDKWVHDKVGRMTAIANVIGVPQYRIQLLCNLHQKKYFLSCDANWDQIIKAMRKVERNEDIELKRKQSQPGYKPKRYYVTRPRVVTRRREVYAWLRAGKGRARALAELTGGLYTKHLTPPEKFQFDYTDARYNTIKAAMQKIEEYENFQICMSVLFSMWFWAKGRTMKDLKRVIDLDSRSCQTYQNITLQNYIRSLKPDWNLIIEGIQQVQKYEKAKVKKKDYAFICSAHQTVKTSETAA